MTELAKALVEFHKDPPHVTLDGKNPHFNSKFATLAGVSAAIRPRAVACGLVWTQEPCVLADGTPGLRTRLLHVSGQEIVSEMPLAISKPGPQEQGSALTYARRYALLSVFGLVGDEDDDANAAQASTARQEPIPEPQSVGTNSLATDPQRKKIAAMAANPQIPMGDDSRTGLLAASEDPNLTRAKATELIDWLVEREKGALV